MAEIPNQPKYARRGGTAWWRWAVGLLVVLLILWVAATRRRPPMRTAAGLYDTTSAGAPAPATKASAAMAVAEYNRWVTAGNSKNDEEAEHLYTAGALDRLADALSDLGATGTDIENMRRQAGAIKGSSVSSMNAGGRMARSAFLSAARAFDTLKIAGTDKVHAAAAAMTTDPRLLDQKDNIQNFFEAARDALLSLRS